LHHIQPDHLGTPRKVIQSSTNTTLWNWPILNNPFGEAYPTGTITLNLRFPGQYFDAETGLHYNYFRDYEPGTGRYIQSDPAGIEAGISTYAYVDSNPIGWTDTLGLAKNKIVERWSQCTDADKLQCRAICAPRNMESCRRRWILGTGIGADGQPYHGWVPKGLSCSCQETFCDKNTATCATGAALGATAFFLGRAAAACAVAIFAN